MKYLVLKWSSTCNYVTMFAEKGPLPRTWRIWTEMHNRHFVGTKKEVIEELLKYAQCESSSVYGTNTRPAFG